MTQLTTSPAWKLLQEQQSSMEKIHMRDLFAEDLQRHKHFSLQTGPLFLDYSKNIITDETMKLLANLARQEDLEAKRTAMFSGKPINFTEGRSVLHTALRNREENPVIANGQDVMPGINEVLDKMENFSNQVREGQWLGYTGKPIKDIVNLGIGGSDLGPKMVANALKPYAKADLSVHFVSNLDGSQIAELLQILNPETTLFIVASKTFTTLETMYNASTARAWFMSKVGDQEQIKKHFVAVSTNSEAVRNFGIDENNMFVFWDWVGGRYSLWSAIGLSIVLSIGMDQFKALLEGAFSMDQHFCEAPLEQNMPVILGLLGVWYSNFFNMSTQAVLTYEHYLDDFPAFLQQLDMESNGKYVNTDGQQVDYNTGPIIWGSQGINGQHAFYQLLHQGTRPVPCDFIIALDTHHPSCGHHPVLMASFLAQTQALMRGKNAAEARAELQASGLSENDIVKLLPHKVFKGNRPTNSIMFKELDPHTLGALIALYEHKVFVQGVIWRINSFDQWGVELGKQLASKIQYDLLDEAIAASHDSSTNGLINYYKSHRSVKGNKILNVDNDWNAIQKLMQDELSQDIIGAGNTPDR